jgi:hypothetical protein
MMLLRRISGVLLLLLGTAGLLACVVAIYEAGVGKKSLIQFVGRAFDSTEKVLENIHDRLTEIDLSVAHVRSDLKKAVSRAKELRPDGAGNKALADYISRALDRDVTEKLAKTRALVDSTVTSVVAVRDSLNLVETSGLVPKETFSRDGALMTRVEEASKTLKRLAGLLEQARQTAQDLQHDSHSEQGLLKLTHEVNGMEKGLAEIQTLGLGFEKTIQGIEDNCRYYQKKTFRYINLGGILIPLLLVWLGVGQAVLIILGGRLCIRREN